MKKKNLLVTCAVAGMLVGSQAALAQTDAKAGKAEASQGKNHCKGEGKDHCDGKAKCEGKNKCKGKKAEGADACSGPDGCGGEAKKEKK